MIPKMKKVRVWLVVVLAVGAVSCDSQFVEPEIPTAPSSFTEEFTGTLSVNGGVSHPFVLLNSGGVTATVMNITRTDPESTATGIIVFGISLGTWTGTACAIATGIFNDQATTGSTVGGNVTSPGTVCLRVYDVGRITENVNYTVQVVHP